jgi:hypothetical protein
MDAALQKVKGTLRAKTFPNNSRHSKRDRPSRHAKVKGSDLEPRLQAAEAGFQTVRDMALERHHGAPLE